MKRKNKNGSHVGMIISFVIFITFIVFLYSVIKPAITTGEDKKTILAAIETQILNNISANFTSASVQLNSRTNPHGNCIELVNFLSFSQFDTPNIIVQNEANVVETAYSDYGNQLPDVMINRKSTSSLFFKTYYSKEFSKLGNTTISCTSLTDYSIGSVTTDLYAFEKEITNFMTAYKNKYSALKDYLKLPPGNDFAFGFTNVSGTTISVGESPASANVYAEDVPVQYVDSKANILSGFINIKVW
jgi:hypothetical protein